MFFNKNKSQTDTSSPEKTIDFASLNEQEKEVRRLHMLLDLSKKLNSVVDLETMLKQVVDDAIEITGAERGFVMLLARPIKLDHRLYNPVITPVQRLKPVLEFAGAR